MAWAKLFSSGEELMAGSYELGNDVLPEKLPTSQESCLPCS